MLETTNLKKHDHRSKSVDQKRIEPDSDDDFFGDLSFDDMFEYQKKLNKRI